MWFFFALLLCIAALGIWMWKRPEPVVRDQARAEQHELWLEQIEAQSQHAVRLLEATPPNYVRAYELFEDLAKQHELPQAYMHMGLMHWRGQGREASLENAIAYLEKAFRLGSDEAAFVLGQIFESQNARDKALYWYRHAVAKGNMDAQYRLVEFDSQHATHESDQQRLQLLKTNAEQGHVQSQYQLAQHYLTAENAHIPLGLEYLFRAAEQDHVAANQQLYNYYTLGQYVEADRERALYYLKRGIALGEQSDLYIYYQAVLMGEIDVDQRQRVHHELLKQGKELKQARAKALLGDAHFHGWYLDKNETLGFRFWSEAAADEDPHALRQIAALHAEEHYLVGDDHRQSLELYRRAEHLSSSVISQMGMALCYLKGKGVEQDIAKARQMLTQAAAKFWQYSVENEADLYYVMGRFYAQPEYPIAEKEKAHAYLEKSAELNNADAAWLSYQLYQENSSLDALSTEALSALKRAAALEHSLALHQLGLYYLNAENTEQNLDQAMHYLQKAAQHGNAQAMTDLGAIYEKKHVDESEFAQAIEYYQRAAALFNADALNHLGRLYIKGEGVTRDLQHAQHLLEKAAVMGHVGAKEQLQNIQDYFEIQESKF